MLADTFIRSVRATGHFILCVASGKIAQHFKCGHVRVPLAVVADSGSSNAHKHYSWWAGRVRAGSHWQNRPMTLAM